MLVKIFLKLNILGEGIQSDPLIIDPFKPMKVEVKHGDAARAEAYDTLFLVDKDEGNVGIHELLVYLDDTNEMATLNLIILVLGSGGDHLNGNVNRKDVSGLVQGINVLIFHLVIYRYL